MENSPAKCKAAIKAVILHRMFSNKTNENVSPGSKKHNLSKNIQNNTEVKKCLKFSTALISYDTLVIVS